MHLETSYETMISKSRSLMQETFVGRRMSQIRIPQWVMCLGSPVSLILSTQRALHSSYSPLKERQHILPYWMDSHEKLSNLEVAVSMMKGRATEFTMVTSEWWQKLLPRRWVLITDMSCFITVTTLLSTQPVLSVERSCSTGQCASFLVLVFLSTWHHNDHSPSTQL